MVASPLSEGINIIGLVRTAICPLPLTNRGVDAYNCPSIHRAKAATGEAADTQVWPMVGVDFSRRQWTTSTDVRAVETHRFIRPDQIIGSSHSVSTN